MHDMRPRDCFHYIRQVALATLLTALPVIATASTYQQIFGWIEWVSFPDVGLRLKTKLDTGAETSSLHATNIVRFKREGERMVRFDLENPESDERFTMELGLERSVRIREHDGSYQRRPVVAMWICLGSLRKKIEVNLVDRTEFHYPFLLGRSAMKGTVIVDPGETFTAEGRCDGRSAAR
jgi:hypothetical protein